MKKNSTEKLLGLLKSIRLSDGERVLMRARLTSQVRAALHAGTGYGRPRGVEDAGSLGAYLQDLAVRIARSGMAPVALALIIVLSAGSGVAVAAEGALPGDILYPVKVHVSEKVASALAVSTEAKANLAARLADERVTEAEKLTEQNSLSTTTRAELKNRLAEHLSDAKKHVGKLKERGRKKAARAVEDELRVFLAAHPDVLDELEVSVSFSDDDSADDSSGFEDRSEELRRGRDSSSDDSSRGGSREDDLRRGLDDGPLHDAGEIRDSGNDSPEDELEDDSPSRSSDDEDEDGSRRGRGGQSGKDDDSPLRFRINF